VSGRFFQGLEKVGPRGSKAWKKAVKIFQGLETCGGDVSNKQKGAA
jgi:hypothetical protein